MVELSFTTTVTFESQVSFAVSVGCGAMAVQFDTVKLAGTFSTTGAMMSFTVTAVIHCAVLLATSLTIKVTLTGVLFRILLQLTEGGLTLKVTGPQPFGSLLPLSIFRMSCVVNVYVPLASRFTVYEASQFAIGGKMSRNICTL